MPTKCCNCLLSWGGVGRQDLILAHDRQWGLILSPKSCGQESPKREMQNTFFEIDGETIGGQGSRKRFQMEEVCLPVRRTHMRVIHVCKHVQRTHTRVIHVCKHIFQTVSGVVHHPLKGLCSVRQPKQHEQILQQAKLHDNHHFWDVCSCSRDLVITLDKFNFWKNIATIQAVGKVLSADSKRLNSAFAISSFSGSRRRDFAKTDGWLPMWIWCSTPWVGVGIT